MSQGLPFPRFAETTFPMLEDEPIFDPERHLQLTEPRQVMNLGDLGYNDGAALCPSNVAMTSTFSVLSDEGVGVLADLARDYKTLQRTTEGDPKEAYVKPRGCAYSSQFVRSFLHCNRVVEFFSDIVGTALTPHTIPSVGATIVYAPKSPKKTNQGWHVDSAGPFSCVVALNQPQELAGGAFQYFHGTLDEAAATLGCSRTEIRRAVGRLGVLPTERVQTLEFGRAGDGILMQGPLVLHRGEPLRKAGERMVLVTSYAAMHVNRSDLNHWSEIQTWNSPTMHTEFARHKAWRVKQLITQQLEAIPVDADRSTFIEAIDVVMEELSVARSALTSSRPIVTDE